MIARRRYVDPTPVPTPASEPFVCLPKPVLKHPPIAHRGRDHTGLLTVFECAVATGIVALARKSIKPERHTFAYDYSKKKLAEKRLKYDPRMSKDVRKDLFDQEFDVLGEIDHNFRREAKQWYRIGWRKFDRSKRPGAVHVQVSKSALLRGAGASRGGKNQKCLADALERLTKPVKVGPEELVPLIDSYELADDGVHIEVNAAWLPRVIGRAALPLPTNGATGLALNLFLAGTDKRSTSTTTITLESLCRAVGIKFRWSSDARDKIFNALEVVNEHLKKLNKCGVLTENELPTAFKIQSVRGGRLRCVAVYDESVRAEEPEMEEIYDPFAAAVPSEPPDRDDEAELRRWFSLSPEEQEREVELKEIERTKGEMAAIVARFAKV